MEMTWQTIATIYQVLFIMAVVYALRELIIEKLNGVRFKRWHILDTGQSGYGILNKSLNEWKILGEKRACSYEDIYKGWAFYTHDNAQNLKLEQVKIEDSPIKYTAYCNKDEYNTNMSAKIFQQLLFIAEKNWLIIITGLCILSIIVSGYGAYTNFKQQEYLDYIVSVLPQKAGDIVANK